MKVDIFGKFPLHVPSTCGENVSIAVCKEPKDKQTGLPIKIPTGITRCDCADSVGCVALMERCGRSCA